MDIAVNAASRAKGLRNATSASHERLDRRIMAAAPFGDRTAYGRFLLVQHAFHSDIDALYRSANLRRLLPDLDEGGRLPRIERDLTDLGIGLPPHARAPAFRPGEVTDVPPALGWLYVSEGSNLGAAFLLKEAAGLGLSETFGARHLAGAPEGRGLRWRTFTAALDAVRLSLDEEASVVSGAEAAFARVLGLVEALLPIRAGETAEDASRPAT